MTVGADDQLITLRLSRKQRSLLLDALRGTVARWARADTALARRISPLPLSEHVTAQVGQLEELARQVDGAARPNPN
jgi:hypothetical protein